MTCYALANVKTDNPHPGHMWGLAGDWEHICPFIGELANLQFK